MYEVELFLGLPLEAELLEALEKIEPDFKDLFIKLDSDIYLEKVTFESVNYLGKKTKRLENTTSLKQLEINIYSLLKRLLPHFSFQQAPLYLFPLIKEMS